MIINKSNEILCLNIMNIHAYNNESIIEKINEHITCYAFNESDLYMLVLYYVPTMRNSLF